MNRASPSPERPVQRYAVPVKRLVAAGVACAAMAFLAALLISEAAAGSPAKPRTASHRRVVVKAPAPDPALARRFSGSPGTLKTPPPPRATGTSLLSRTPRRP